jgi:hypothetical protein
MAVADLQVVIIENSGKVIRPVMGRGHRGFPDLLLLAFAVPQKDIHPVIPLIKISG